MSEHPLPRERSFLHGTRLVLGREIGAWSGWTFVAVAFVAAVLAAVALLAGETFERLPLALVLLAPAIAVHAWSRDRRERTFELWRTLPLEPAQVALGKYAASFALYALFLAGTLPVPLLRLALGRAALAPVAAAYLGAALAGAVFLAIAQFLAQPVPRD